MFGRGVWRATDPGACVVQVGRGSERVHLRSLTTCTLSKLDTHISRKVEERRAFILRLFEFKSGQSWSALYIC